MFDEAEWIRLLFLLADTQSWLDDLCKNAFIQLPVDDKKKLARKTYFLTCTSFAHIIEKHYYKINRYPQAGKFTIPVTAIIQILKDCSAIIPEPIAGSLNFSRMMKLNTLIGFDMRGQPANEITVITDAAGKIITAFPGKMQGTTY